MPWLSSGKATRSFWARDGLWADALRPRGGSLGQDLVEMALLVPVLLAFLLGIVEFGVVVWRQNTVANAAREGARAGVVGSCSATSVENGVDRLTAGLAPAPVVVSDDTDGVCTVTVSYPHHLITGGFLQAFGVPAMIDLSATSAMIIE